MPAPAADVVHQPLLHRVGATDKRLSYQARCSCGWESEWTDSAGAADLALSAHLGGAGRWS